MGSTQERETHQLSSSIIKITTWERQSLRSSFQLQPICTFYMVIKFKNRWHLGHSQKRWHVQVCPFSDKKQNPDLPFLGEAFPNKIKVITQNKRVKEGQGTSTTVTFFKVNLRKEGQGFPVADVKMTEDYRTPEEAIPNGKTSILHQELVQSCH